MRRVYNEIRAEGIINNAPYLGPSDVVSEEHLQTSVRRGLKITRGLFINQAYSTWAIKF